MTTVSYIHKHALSPEQRTDSALKLGRLLAVSSLLEIPLAAAAEPEEEAPPPPPRALVPPSGVRKVLAIAGELVQLVLPPVAWACSFLRGKARSGQGRPQRPGRGDRKGSVVTRERCDERAREEVRQLCAGTGGEATGLQYCVVI